MNYNAIKLAISNTRNRIAENIFLKFGIDFTKPVQIHALLTNRCNAKCPMCDIWRENEFFDLPASVWINALRSLKSLSGTFHINFSGGEPLLKGDFFEILEFCKKEKIIAGFTTNGLLLTPEHIKRIIEKNPMNINISLDSMDPEIHDSIRGIPGLFNRVKKNIENLVEEIHKAKSNIQVILKPTVSSVNIKGVEKIAAYADELNITGVNYQPIFKWSDEASEMFNVDKKQLLKTIDKLTEMKKAGSNIINSEESIKQWHTHFEEILPEQNTPCVVALRNLAIRYDGDIYLCVICNTIIGNIENDNIQEVWRSKETAAKRKILVRCKRVCTASCVVKRSWKDYFQLFYRLVK